MSGWVKGSRQIGSTFCCLIFGFDKGLILTVHLDVHVSMGMHGMVLHGNGLLYSLGMARWTTCHFITRIGFVLDVHICMGLHGKGLHGAGLGFMLGLARDNTGSFRGWPWFDLVRISDIKRGRVLSITGLFDCTIIGNIFVSRDFLNNQNIKS